MRRSSPLVGGGVVRSTSRFANLGRHLNNVRNHYGLPCVVAVNHFVNDTDAELALLERQRAHHEVPLMVGRH